MMTRAATGLRLSVARGRPRKDALPDRQAHSYFMAPGGSGQHAVLWDVWERPEPLGLPGGRGHGTMSTRRVERRHLKPAAARREESLDSRCAVVRVTQMRGQAVPLALSRSPSLVVVEQLPQSVVKHNDVEITPCQWLAGIPGHITNVFRLVLEASAAGLRLVRRVVGANQAHAAAALTRVIDSQCPQKLGFVFETGIADDECGDATELPRKELPLGRWHKGAAAYNLFTALRSVGVMWPVFLSAVQVIDRASKPLQVRPHGQAFRDSWVAVRRGILHGARSVCCGLRNGAIASPGLGYN